MASSTLTPSLLNYINHGAYPDTEAISSATLTPDTLAGLLNSLRQAQDDAKDSIRQLSRSVAPDIDAWISRAKELQADILRSRKAAREIVAEAEKGDDLKARLHDAASKVQFLEREVQFEETLTGTLEHVQHANALLDRTRDQAVVGNVKALAGLEDAEASIAALEGLSASRAHEVLRRRAEGLKENMVETATECWNSLVHVDVEGRRVGIARAGLKTALPDAAVPELNFEHIVPIVQALGVFESLVHKLSRDFERAILQPRMTINEDEQIPHIAISSEDLSCNNFSSDTSTSSLIADLHSTLDFLSTRLPAAVAVPLSGRLVPALSKHLSEDWLEPEIPTSMAGLPGFERVLTEASELARHINQLGWYGGSTLKEVAHAAPRLWLTKRREVVLGDVRNLIFAGPRERKVVERVETRVVTGEEAGLVAGSGGSAAGQEGGEEDWDTAWDEPEERTMDSDQTRAEDVRQEDEDEDSSAWDMDEDDPMAEKETSAADGEGDAWGWGDEDPQSAKPSSPVASRKAAGPNVNGGTAVPKESQTSEREMTLRETFTVTAVPDGILHVLQEIISNAQTLAGPEFVASSIAPVSAALYTFPTLALAIYRATAPTAYGKLAVGNMLIYNDALHLASQLRAWQASQPPASRLRVDADVKALESFAKRAYASEMDSQRTILRDLLDGAQGFANCTTPPFRAECESAVAQVVDRLRDVHALWKDVLSQGALLQSLGGLLATCTQQMISDIQDLGDISEADSKQLAGLCRQLSAVKELFTSRAEGGGEEHDMTFVYCPSWLKFQYLAEILESSLADIRWMWKEGELSLEFEAEEVVELVLALFAESELRRRAVAEIRRGGRG